MNVVSLIDRKPAAKVRFAAIEIGLIALEREDGWLLAKSDEGGTVNVIAGDDEYGPWSGFQVIEYSKQFQEFKAEGVMVWCSGL